MNKSKHLSVDFCSAEEAPTLVNDPRFMSLEEFDDGCCEVNMQGMGFWVYPVCLFCLIKLLRVASLLGLPVPPYTGDVEEEERQIQSADPDWVFRLPVRQVTHAGLLL